MGRWKWLTFKTLIFEGLHSVWTLSRFVSTMSTLTVTEIQSNLFQSSNGDSLEGKQKKSATIKQEHSKAITDEEWLKKYLMF